YGALVARAEPDPRRALGLAALVPAGLIVLALAGQHHEGVLAAIMLALAVTLGGAAGLLAYTNGDGPRARLLRRLAPVGLLPAPGLVGLIGAALVVLGTARFAGTTLGGHAIWLALLAGLATLLSLRALSRRAGPAGPGAKDSSRGPLIGVAALLLPVIAAGVWPARVLGPSHAVARAWVDMTTRGRCERAVRTGDALARAPAEPSEACGQPLRTLEQGGRP
ncbi:MAG TPA: hypothetical protein VGB85_09140, partial [Nannocystis sp.]